MRESVTNQHSEWRTSQAIYLLAGCSAPTDRPARCPYSLRSLASNAAPSGFSLGLCKGRLAARHDQELQLRPQS